MVESISMEKGVKKPKNLKRKKKTTSPIEAKSIKLHGATDITDIPNDAEKEPAAENTEPEQPPTPAENIDLTEVSNKFPVLKNEELIKKFLAVPMSNNQKGRIRQVLKDNLKGTSDHLLPEVIHNKIQSIIKTDSLTAAELRKIRILYNMLKTAVVGEKEFVEKKQLDKKSAEKKKKLKKKKNQVGIEGEKIEKVKEEKVEDNDEKKEPLVQKVKGKKRYVVFVGNLPLTITEEMIKVHFSDLASSIVDIRLPKPKEGKKSAIAYVELKDEPTYEMALSKHHSMLANKRINVLYTAQKNGKVTEAQAKSKSAKLQALQKSGKLIGSTAMSKKRSQRRLKLKKFRAMENQDLGGNIYVQYV